MLHSRLAITTILAILTVVMATPSSVAAAEAKAVATATSPAGMPVADRTCGLTKRMYDMARKVTTPARTSVATVVPAASRPK